MIVEIPSIYILNYTCYNMGQIRGGIMKKIDITSINFDKVVKINDDISSESADRKSVV